ncbi:ensconsin isoform X2 [Callorhinchus milii]|uniref:ensconsin isoform X2 n=1 Tax=Callorhinchus milii TaxID=7868 RepID=UPI001C3F52E0|nr:ensconsin isoform X2 [Callorhinchus milii]
MRAGPELPLFKSPAARERVRLWLTSGVMAEVEGVVSRADGGGIEHFQASSFDGESIVESWTNKDDEERIVEASEAQVKVEDKKGQSSSRPTSANSGQSVNSDAKQELHALKVDDKQRLAKERREERQKQLVARDILLLEKEEKARQHYERQLVERKKKIQEQRLKEEKRRAAVEEKRRQRLEEEKERHEAVVRRTIERSQRAKQKQNRWSWGGALQRNTTINRDGDFVESSYSYLDLAGLEHHLRNEAGACKDDADRRSVSTMNLSKHVDPVINKRLSSSSATLLNSPDRALKKRIAYFLKCSPKPRSTSTRNKFSAETKPVRRLQLSPWESNIVTRLLTPTHSFLARSRSTAALSGNGQDSVIPICPRSASASLITQPTCRNLHNRMSDWPKVIITTHDVNGRRRTTHSPMVDKSEREKNIVTTLPVNTTVKRSHSPSNVKSKPPVPSTARSANKAPASDTSTPKLPISPPSSANNLPIQRPPSPGNVRPKYETEKKDQAKGNLKPEENLEEKPPMPPIASAAKVLAPVEESKEAPTTLPSASPGKLIAGTTDREEATRLLTEKRREAREQRDRDEEEKREQEERERLMKEEMLRRKAEERARREEESRRLEEDRKLKEEEQKVEDERKHLEQKAQKEKEELERLQKQKEEEARAREEAEKLKLERERHFQKEEQERMERKRRLEQIMKRTRKSDASEKKDNTLQPVVQRNGEVPKVSTLEEKGISRTSDEKDELQITSSSGDRPKEEAGTQELGNNGEFTYRAETDIECPAAIGKVLKENGVSEQNQNFEEIIDLPVETKSTKQATGAVSDGQGDGAISVNPIIAFEENRSLELLSKVDGVSSQQTAEVI